MKEHTIKFRGKQICDDVYSGLKKFEYRYNDRGYRAGDIIHPIPLDDNGQEFEHPLSTVTYKILYILYGPSFGIPDGYCVFTIEDVNAPGNKHSISIFMALTLGSIIGSLVMAWWINLIG